MRYLKATIIRDLKVKILDKPCNNIVRYERRLTNIRKDGRGRRA